MLQKLILQAELKACLELCRMLRIHHTSALQWQLCDTVIIIILFFNLIKYNKIIYIFIEQLRDMMTLFTEIFYIIYRNKLILKKLPFWFVTIYEIKGQVILWDFEIILFYFTNVLCYKKKKNFAFKILNPRKILMYILYKLTDNNL